jgi:hypothetical protein
MFDSCNEDDDLDEVKSLILTTLEDNAEYDESSLKESKITDYISPEKLDLYIKSNPILKDTLKDYHVLDDMVIEVTTDMGISYYKSIINNDGDIELYLISKSGNKLGDSFLLKEAETPEAMQKIADKQMPEGGYRYIATHAIGPGTLPKDVKVFKTEDISGGKIAMYISRPLTSEELKQYDIKPEWIQEDSSYRRYKVSFFVDTDSMNNMEIEEKLNDILKGSGLASADETIDVEKVEDLEEAVDLPADAQSFSAGEVGEPYSEYEDACKLNAAAAYADDNTEEIYAGTVDVNGTTITHFFNVKDGKVIDHSATANNPNNTLTNYKGINVTELLRAKGFKLVPAKAAFMRFEDGNGNIIEVGNMSNRIWFTYNNKGISYDELKNL